MVRICPEPDPNQTQTRPKLKIQFSADLALLRQIKKDLRESSRVGEDAAGKTKLALLREKFKNAKKQKDQMTNEKEAASLR